MVAYNYDTDHAQFSRFIQMLRVHLWGGSCANTMCPGAMTDGAARLLEQQLGRPDLDPTQRRVLQDAFDRLTSRDPARAWTSGQWMTERTGGSDVSLTETTATLLPDGGAWSVTGFKFFSSATDADMTILLARTSPSQPPSAFFAPMRRGSAAALNGIRISRLKDKLGTRPVPTAELELAGLRAHLLGPEGRGVAQLGPVLAVTRAHSAVASLAYLGRALAVARSYALVRTVGAGRGRRVPLCRSPLHVRTLAGLAAAYRGLMLLVFLGVYVLGLDETTTSRGKEPAVGMIHVPPRHVEPLARVLGSLVKAYACKTAVPLLFACVEALGGVGYLNNAESEVMNVARLFRDGCVNSIWEGTTDVLSADLLRVLKHPGSGAQCLDAFGWLVRSLLGVERDEEVEGERRAERGEGGLVLDEWAKLRARIKTETQDDLAGEARDVLFRMAEMLIAALLVADWRRDGTPDALVVYRRFMVKSGLASASRYSEGLGETLEMDATIVYGKDGPRAEAAGAKL